MTKYTFLILVAASLIFPIGAYAAQSNRDKPEPWLRDRNSVESTATKQQLAQHHDRRKRRHHRGNRINAMLQQLDLTAGQSQQIETINQEFKAKNEALKQEMKDNRQAKISSLEADTSTEDLRQQHQTFQALQQQFGDNRFEMMLQIREVLTPEQRGQLAELIEQKRK